MFGNGKIIGPILIVVGIGILIVAVLFFGVGISESSITKAGAVMGIVLMGFCPMALFGGVGVYLLVSAGKEADEVAVIRKKERILGLIQSQGQASVGSIMVELDLTKEQVTNAIYELVGMGLFTGYIDWDKLTFYSKSASAVGSNQCPNCGGIRELVGMGVVKCPYCEVALFIPPNAEQTSATPKPPPDEWQNLIKNS